MSWAGFISLSKARVSMEARCKEKCFNATLFGLTWAQRAWNLAVSNRIVLRLWGEMTRLNAKWSCASRSKNWRVLRVDELLQGKISVILMSNDVVSVPPAYRLIVRFSLTCRVQMAYICFDLIYSEATADCVQEDCSDRQPIFREPLKLFTVWYDPQLNENRYLRRQNNFQRWDC